MKKKLSKVLAVVLSLVMVFGLAAVDTTAVGQAKKATKLTLVKSGKKAVKSGQSRTIKINGTNAKKAKWTVKGTGKQYIKLSKKQGAVNSFEVKANATGKAKIVAKLTKKNKVTVTYTLSCATTGIDFADDSKDVKLETGATTTLKLVAVPSNAACPAATYEVVAVKDGAESKPADGVVTCAAVEGGVSFGANAEGTYKVTATAGTYTAVATVTVADRVAVLQSAKQTEINKLELTFDSDCSNVKDVDVEITSNVGTRLNVKTITVDAKDKTKCVVETLVDINDGKENKVAYKGAEVTFTASNGKVASLEISPATAPINTVVPVVCKSLDANGVLLATIKYGDSSQSSYDFMIDIPDGGALDDANNAIKMETVGAKATATVTYRSGEFDADNNPVEITATQVITAVAAGNISGVKEYTFVSVDKADDEQKYSDLDADAKNKTSIKIKYNGTEGYALYALVEDDLGFTRVDGTLTSAGYVLSSADDTIATVDGSFVQAVKAGKTYIIVSNEEGKALFTVPVEVLAAPVLTTIKTDASYVQLSLGNKSLPSKRTTWTTDAGTIEVTAYDQYGDEYTAVDTAVDTAANVSSNRDTYVVATVTGEKCEFKAGEIAVGDYNEDTATGMLAAGKSHTNYYEFTVTDQNNSDVSKTKRVYVKVTQPKYSALKSVKLETASKKDTTLSKDSDNDVINEAVKLAIYDTNGTFVAYDYLPNTTSAVVVKKAGKEVKDAVVVSSAAVTYVSAGSLEVPTDSANNDNYNFMIRNFKVDNTILAVADKIGTGSYQIRVNGVKFVSGSSAETVRADFSKASTTTVSLAAASSNYVSATVNVTDSQATPVLGQQYKSLDDVSDPATVLKKAFRVTVKDAADNYDPDAETPAEYKFVADKCVTNESSVAFTKVTVYVPYAGTKYVKNTISVGYTVKKQ